MLNLIVEIVSLTSSGALSPGPLTFSAIVLGMKKGWKAGFLEAVGHTLFEFPLVLLIGVGSSHIINNELFLNIAGMIGGLALIIFSILLLQDLISLRRGDGERILKISGGPILTGFLFTALNPYFIVWWTTVGLKLIIDIILAGGILFVIFLYPIHVWMDYLWLSLVSYLSSKGRKLGVKIQAGILIIFIIILMYYGIKFIIESVI
mgnify:CR=1 FL=1